ncbi:MAG: hypothetical protein LBU25_08180 [Treponema sp.]|nr:hypothetical protein [Treponema sp.]
MEKRLIATKGKAVTDGIQHTSHTTGDPHSHGDRVLNILIRFRKDFNLQILRLNLDAIAGHPAYRMAEELRGQLWTINPAAVARAFMRHYITFTSLAEVIAIILHKNTNSPPCLVTILVHKKPLPL